MRSFILITILFLFGCKQTGHPKKTVVTKLIDTAQCLVKTKKITKGQTDYKKSQTEDHIQLNIMLHDILLYANKHKSSESYYKKLETWDVSSTTATLKFGHLFSQAKKHLIVSRMMSGSTVNIDVFILEKSKFRLLFSQPLDCNTYVNDAIRDVNGDHQKDFLVHWYPSSGCCRRDIYDVYIYQKGSGAFTKEYEFINPTFSPSEKVVRGVGYGQPGATELYKYKWNGLKVDTVEFIFPDTAGSKYYTTNRTVNLWLPDKCRLLSAIPKEYHSIKSYDWFKGIY